MSPSARLHRQCLAISFAAMGSLACASTSATPPNRVQNASAAPSQAPHPTEADVKAQGDALANLGDKRLSELGIDGEDARKAGRRFATTAVDNTAAQHSGLTPAQARVWQMTLQNDYLKFMEKFAAKVQQLQANGNQGATAVAEAVASICPVYPFCT